MERAGNTVCIIGAGPAGLAAARALKAEGLDFHIFDPRDRVGGIWAYDPAPGRTCAWETMNLNSPRGWYEFSDAPMPADYPDFPRRDQVAAYLEGLVDRGGLRPHLHLSEAVTEVAPEGTRWRVRTDAGRAASYAAVIVANGHHNEPFVPDRPGSFTGTAIHSQDYRYREAFRGKRVLVVGIGNSGSQIAVDVSLAAEQTYLSVRRGVWVLPHYIRGLRVDRAMPAFLNHLVAAYVPERLAGPMLSLYYRLLLGSPARGGLPRPDHHFGQALPTVSENLFNRLGDGRVRVRPDVAAFDGGAVAFADGTREAVDAVIWCTGYRNRFPFLAADVFAPEENRAPLYFRAFHPDRPGLYFVGLLQAVGWGFLPLFEAQARLVAAHLSGRYALPPADTMRRAIAADAAQVARRFVASPRNQYQMNAEVFRHACARELRAGLRRAG
jgi:cation diffusion facilitator CzcD-associated flavoprotein CzcO